MQGVDGPRYDSNARNPRGSTVVGYRPINPLVFVIAISFEPVLRTRELV